MEVEVTLNRPDGQLPFGLFYPPENGKLTWTCGYSQVNEIISVFCMDLGDHKEREDKFLKDEEQARFCRDELLKNGWKVLTPPKVEFTITDKDGVKRPLTRREHRYMNKLLQEGGPK